MDLTASIATVLVSIFGSGGVLALLIRSNATRQATLDKARLDREDLQDRARVDRELKLDQRATDAQQLIVAHLQSQLATSQAAMAAAQSVANASVTAMQAMTDETRRHTNLLQLIADQLEGQGRVCKFVKTPSPRARKSS